jgi:hypothetical protein
MLPPENLGERHLELNIQVRRAALTAEQAGELNLPTTPLKETECRTANWEANGLNPKRET